MGRGLAQGTSGHGPQRALGIREAFRDLVCNSDRFPSARWELWRHVRSLWPWAPAFVGDTDLGLIYGA